MNRIKTRQIKVGSVCVGGNAPISVQSMTNTNTANVRSTVSQILKLERAGCEIIRVAIPDEDSALALSKIKKQISIPIIADIHFDYKLALLSIKNGADALRINPGNIGSKEKIKEVIECAKDYNISLRIGVNAGSIEKSLKDKDITTAMLESAEKNINLLNSLDFYNFKVSLKASNVLNTINAYQEFSKKFDYPLHIGITEAGSICPGLVKSSIGIGFLLYSGIGDTIRVSLSADPIFEVKAGYDILRALEIRKKGIEIISCPTCGRCQIKLFSLLKKVEKKLESLNIDKNLKIAIMGCPVNGPGEAKEADLGIAGGKGLGIIFKKGEVVKKVPYENLFDEFFSEIKKL